MVDFFRECVMKGHSTGNRNGISDGSGSGSSDDDGQYMSLDWHMVRLLSYQIEREIKRTFFWHSNIFGIPISIQFYRKHFNMVNINPWLFCWYKPKKINESSMWQKHSKRHYFVDIILNIWFMVWIWIWIWTYKCFLNMFTKYEKRKSINHTSTFYIYMMCLWI